MDPLFQFHKLNEEGIAKAVRIAEAFTRLMSELNDIIGVTDGSYPVGREFAITKTKLEEASFFAKKAMAIQTRNQAA
jgi:hypothetical protein